MILLIIVVMLMEVTLKARTIQIQMKSTPRKYAFLPCGHLDFESAVKAQNDEFKGVFIACIFTLVKRQNLAKKLNT